MVKTLATSSKTIKAYLFWPGFQRFICEGRIMIPKSLRKPLIFLTILSTSQLMYYFSLIRKTNEDFLMILLSSLLFLLSLLSTLRLISSNPGYIPRQTAPFARGPVKTENYSTIILKYPSKSIALDKQSADFPINGSLIRLKYCKTCLVLRPPRASHCNDCGLCVEVYDHHCPWLGTCIGRKNYKLFYTFLICNWTFLAFNWASAAIQIFRLYSPHLSFFLKFWGFLMFFFISCIALVFFTALLGFHSFLVLKQITTREYMKKTWKQTKLVPYAKRNFWLSLHRSWFQTVNVELFDRFSDVSLELDVCNIIPSLAAVKSLREETRCMDRSMMEKSNSSLNFSTTL